MKITLEFYQVMDPSSHFQSRVLTWFDAHGRKDLPWQTPRDPYRVWISEVMLQQTQVITVIDYFHRFLARFPSLKALSESPVEAVLSLWAGLGYYARARNLHRTAQILMTAHGGEFPASLDELIKLPGIGRSTAGAILSLGFGIRAPILDGNVRRVLARHAAIGGWPGQADTLRALWALSETLTPESRVADFNQAMMDLGSLICTPKTPACEACPLAMTCLAFRYKAQPLYPGRKPSRALPTRVAYWLIIRNTSGHIYLETRPDRGIWGGLLSPPEFDSLEALQRFCIETWGSAGLITVMPQRRHTFSHFHLDFFPVLSDIEQGSERATSLCGAFHPPGEMERLPAPVLKLMTDLTA